MQFVAAFRLEVCAYFLEIPELLALHLLSVIPAFSFW